MRKDWLRLGFAILVAALLWFYMFSPWTHGAPNFWIVMSFSAVTLMSLGLGLLRTGECCSRWKGLCFS